mmetsp:Transcript_3216/g.7237  ORF Transcript_3216/g.7237 Transcript_3216/m.7237 type:complete len:308 (-) Transcript_3216:696-1619(-)
MPVYEADIRSTFARGGPIAPPPLVADATQGRSELPLPPLEERHEHAPVLPPRVVQRRVAPLVAQHEEFRRVVEEEVEYVEVRLGAPARVVERCASEVVPDPERRPSLREKHAYDTHVAPPAGHVHESLAEAVPAVQHAAVLAQPPQARHVVPPYRVHGVLDVHLGDLDEVPGLHVAAREDLGRVAPGSEGGDHDVHRPDLDGRVLVLDPVGDVGDYDLVDAAVDARDGRARGGDGRASRGRGAVVLGVDLDRQGGEDVASLPPGFRVGTAVGAVAVGAVRGGGPGGRPIDRAGDPADLLLLLFVMLL